MNYHRSQPTAASKIKQTGPTRLLSCLYESMWTGTVQSTALMVAGFIMAGGTDCDEELLSRKDCGLPKSKPG